MTAPEHPPTSMPILQSLSRRQLIVGGALSLAWLASCGSDEDSASTTTPTTGPSSSPAETQPSNPAGPWEFTDDRGVTVTLDAPPTRLVVYPWTLLAGLWSFGARPVGSFGNLVDNSAVSNVDVSTVTSVGDEGLINMEQLAALTPDLQIVELNPEGTLRFMEDTSDEAEAVAPLLAIALSDLSVTEALTRIEELAVALGLDANGADVAAARGRFQDASAAFSAFADTNPELTVMFCYADTDGVLLYNPQMFPDLRLLADLGLNILRPETTEWYDTISWELISERASADVIFRMDFAVPPIEPDNPVWPTLPAVAAEQVDTYGPGWEQYTYDNWAAILTELTATLEGAKADVA